MPQLSARPSASIEELTGKPYIDILCYPRAEEGEALRRVEELRGLAVDRLVFEGRTQVGSLRILGKGCVSLVVKAITSEGEGALKIRRMDANRPSMEPEARLHRMANGVEVGPGLYRSSQNFLLMELVRGLPIVEWLRTLKGPGTTGSLRAALKALLDQCYSLDWVGLDHGELSNLNKHVFIGERVVVLDFETASINRRPANITSSTQYLFIGGPCCRKVRRLLRLTDVQVIIEAVRRYKAERVESNYRRLLETLKLIPRGASAKL